MNGNICLSFLQSLRRHLRENGIKPPFQCRAPPYSRLWKHRMVEEGGGVMLMSCWCHVDAWHFLSASPPPASAAWDPLVFVEFYFTGMGGLSQTLGWCSVVASSARGLHGFPKIQYNFACQILNLVTRHFYWTFMSRKYKSMLSVTF